ncbi:MAG: hypothetical protein A2Z99_15585 [Treponema sp. GWB1_62_6]|nr:MAG: hypothetical protein A2Z99_15585 [Treponema sp. GWB1_62_6]OHE65524.1 MAG: hypothetical protein A2001_10370 [Treponema sp. GWC1_61_84]HCM27727.1 hypothetical protein [Treponema sp.]
MVEKKYIAIAEKIRTDIDRGVFPEGSKIPPIRKLAEIYGVNPQTVNKATAYLASLGYLDARRGAGSTVRKPTAVSVRRRVPMLVDRSRARLLDDLDDIANFHGKDIYLGYLMETAVRGDASGFMIYDRDEDAAPEGFAEEMAGAWGVIVQGSLPECRSAVLAAMDIPTVLINRKPTQVGGRFASVLIPMDRLKEMANYLASLGHRRFLFALSDRFELNAEFEARMSAFRCGLDGWGLDEDAVVPFVYTEASARHADLLASEVTAGRTAAVAYNDVSALGLYGLAARIGLDLPRDLSIVGFDDIALAQIASPPLTTIHVDRRDLVRKAFAALDELASGSAPLRIEIEVPTTLSLRQSAFRAP